MAPGVMPNSREIPERQPGIHTSTEHMSIEQSMRSFRISISECSANISRGILANFAGGKPVTD